MKNKLFAFGGTLLLAALAFSSINANSTSLQELKAEAAPHCTPNSNTDCESSATGNVYAGYIPGE